jgi:pimeloyl-ACP methyl ester carboxylesterase/DNA-binding CsgD family transcriptional regulator
VTAAAVIRYCTTPAGRVAYSVTGSGPALLCDPGWVTHASRQLGLFSFGAFTDRLARRHTVIRYDKPGCGLSDRNGADLSFDAQVKAALAVADAAGARTFSLFGASQGGHVAAAIAARYPERVDALVLYGTCASGADLAPAEVRESLVALVRAHWGLGSKVLTAVFVPGPEAADVAAFTAAQREGASAATAARLLEVYYQTDLRDQLPSIRARTAVLHRTADPATPFELGREIAALVPGAGLVPLPGDGHLYYHGQWQPVLDAALSFLDEPARPESGPADGGPADADPANQGATPRRDAPAPPVRLTARELEVARLIADGLTNQAIASRLSVAPRTAESHVENIRRKLAVRSRAQIAAWVTERRLRG